jgi:hypothetical protein
MLNGNAAQSGSKLQLVADSPGQAGSSFTTSAIDFTADFDTQFQYAVASAANSPSLGFAYVLENDPAGAAALGSKYGYDGIANSLAVVFDETTDTVSLFANGDTSTALESKGFTPYTGTGMSDNSFVRIQYIQETGDVRVFVDPAGTPPGQLSSIPLIDYAADTGNTLDLGSLMGGSGTGYGGFTASTGSRASASFSIQSWDFNNNPAPAAFTLAVPTDNNGAPLAQTAGTGFSLTATALDEYGNPNPTYTGTISFSSSDPKVSPGKGLPEDYTFQSNENGQHTFTGVTLYTAGSQTITGLDTTSGNSATSPTIPLNAATANKLVLGGLAASTTVGEPQSFTVTAYDPYGNVATGYLGTVQFTSSDGNAGLPGPYPFTSGDAGSHTFSVTFNTANTNTAQSLTVTDQNGLTNTAYSTVSPAGTKTKLTSTADGTGTSVYGSQLTFTATISAVAPGGGTPTGSVSFEEGDTVLDTETLVNGSASYTTTKLNVAPHTITAVYSNSDGNYTDSSDTDSVKITAASLKVTVADEKKQYGLDDSADLTGRITGIQNNDPITATYTSGGSAATASVPGGPYTINATLSDGGTGALSNYTVTIITGSLTVTPAPLTITAASDSKQYDGTTTSAQTPTVSGTLYNGDTVTGLSQAFASRHVLGTYGSTLGVSGYTVNDGQGGANYAVTTQGASGTITPAPLAILATTDSKQYDGTTTSAQTPTVSGTLYSTDTVTGLSQAFTSRHVLGSNGSTLTVTGYTVNDDNGGKDYAVSTQGASGTITPAPLTISAAGDSKQYDGTTSSSKTPTVSGILYSTDTVTGLSQAFASRHVLGTNGSSLVVTGYTVNDGNEGADYTVTTQNASGTITPAPLTISATSDSKQYDGTTTSSQTPAVSGTLYGEDSVTGLGQAFASRHVFGSEGSTLLVTSYTVNDDNDGRDYAVTTQTATGTITPAPLTITATSDNKQYDGTTTSAQTPTVSGALYSTDTVTGLSQAFASRHVLGSNQSTLLVTGYTVNDGNGGADYQVTIHSASGTITPAPLTITATSDTKQYDGTSTSLQTPTVSGTLYGSDTVTGLSQAFTSRHVLGTNGSTLVVTSYTVNDGNGGADYTVATQNAEGTITPAALTITATTDSKQYDGTTTSSQTPTVSGTLYGEDSVTGQSQAFASRHVLGDDGSLLEVTGYTVNDGNGGEDYNVATQSASGTITPAPLTVSATTDSKQYDGTTSSTKTPTVSGTLYGSDTVIGLSQVFASRHVLGDNGSTLVVSGYTVQDGNGGADYQVTTHNASGTITPAPLTITATSDTKQYDGTDASAQTPTVSTLYGTDTVTGLSQAFTSRHVLGNNGSTLEVTGYTVNDGNGGADYTVANHSASGTITPAPLTISAASDSKQYDGTTTSAQTPTVSGTLYSTDTVTGLSQAFTSRHVLGNNGSTLEVTGYTVNDGNGGKDYNATTQSASGTITPAPLTLSAASDSKQYDGTTPSGKTPTVSGTLYGGDTVTGLSQAFASRHVLGTNGSILEVTGYTVNDGNGGNDYAVATRSASGTITPAPLTISAASDTKQYDGTTSSLQTPTVSGTLYSTDSITELSQAFASRHVLGSGGSTLVITSYTVQDENGGADYKVTTQSTRGTITAAPLAINATSDSKQYDGTTASNQIPTISGTLYNTDTVTGLSQAFASRHVLGDNGSTLVVTGYTVNDGDGGADYTVTTHSATGTITPAPLTISATSDSKQYDGTTASGQTPTVGTLYSSDTVTGLSQAFASRHVLGTNGSILEVTGFTVNDGNGGADYQVTTHSAQGTISPTPLTLTATSDTKQYDGTTTSSQTPTVSGTLYGSDTVTSLSQAFTSRHVLGTNGSTLVVTSYIVQDGNGGADYQVTTHSTQGTITPAPLTVTVADATKQYGTDDSASLTGVLSGVLNGDPITASYSSDGSSAKAFVAGSPYAIKATLSDGGTGSLGDYKVTIHAGSLTVMPAPLTVTVAKATKQYGTDDSGALSGLLSGILNGDPITAAYHSDGSAATASVAGSPYSIGATLSDDETGALGNYTVTIIPSTLTVTPAPLTVTVASLTKVYGTDDSASLTGMITGIFNNDPITATYTSDGSAAKAPVSGSPYPILATLSDGGSGALGNYGVTIQNGSLTVLPAALTITADNHSVLLGQPLPKLTASYSGFVNGETPDDLTTAPTLSTKATASSPAGTYPIIASGAVDPNYSITYVAGSLIIKNPVPALTGLIPAVSADGQSLDLTLTGSDFVETSTLQMNGKALPTMFVDSTQLTATISVSAIQNLDSISLAVVNPEPGGGSSNVVAINPQLLLNPDLLAGIYGFIQPPQTSMTLTLFYGGRAVIIGTLQVTPQSQASGGLFLGLYRRDPDAVDGQAGSPGDVNGVMFFDVRLILFKPAMLDGATLAVTANYGAAVNGTPGLLFFDPAVNQQVAVTPTTVDTAHNQVSTTLSDASMPTLRELLGTVFAITVTNPAAVSSPQASPSPSATAAPTVTAQATTTTVNPALALAGNNSFAQTTTFFSSGQLTLALTPSSDSQASASRTSLSGQSSGGGDDPDADDYLNYYRRMLGEDLFWDWLQSAQSSAAPLGPADEGTEALAAPVLEAPRSDILETLFAAPTALAPAAARLAPLDTENADPLALETFLQVAEQPQSPDRLDAWWGVAALLAGLATHGRRSKDRGQPVEEEE